MPVTLTPNQAWALLLVAGLLEVVWLISLKASHGFTKSNFTTVTFVAAALSFWLLGLALRQLPVGTAYAVWTGIGAVGAAVLGIVVFGESLTLARIGCIALIVCGIVGLKLIGGESAAQPHGRYGRPSAGLRSRRGRRLAGAFGVAEHTQ
jgi:quaternary ammonium compound-resistance protein SugE